MVKISVDFIFTLIGLAYLTGGVSDVAENNDQTLSKFQARISVSRGTDFVSPSTSVPVGTEY